MGMQVVLRGLTYSVPGLVIKRMLDPPSSLYLITNGTVCLILCNDSTPPCIPVFQVGPESDVVSLLRLHTCVKCMTRGP